MQPVAEILETPTAEAGSQEAFTALYRTHSPAVFRFALHMTGDRMKAAEITQDVFVWLVHHPNEHDPARGPLGPFLAGVARQMIHRQQRNERRWLSFDSSAPPAANTPDPTRAADLESLRRAIALLPLRYREAVVLCDLEGHSYDEAAQVAGCAVGTIRSRLHRGRELLERKFLMKGKS
jgi:RNA polymerase sigma-70 factor (ECF subfamily)